MEKVPMIYLVRHGETDWNLFKRANGVTETFLNQTGINQAKIQAENLKNINFDVCFCSTQIRARQFYEIICKKDVDTFFDKRLAEIDCGEFEGIEETADTMHMMFEATKTGDRGVETMEAFIKRNSEICEIICEKYKSKNILIVTHAINVTPIDWYFKGKPKEYNWTKRVIQKGELITYNN